MTTYDYELMDRPPADIAEEVRRNRAAVRSLSDNDLLAMLGWAQHEQDPAVYSACYDESRRRKADSFTLIRMRMKAADAGVATYLVTRASDADALLAGAAEDGNGAEILPWDVLPYIPGLAAEFAGQPERAVSVLGTAVDGRWTSWYAPIPAPPVPCR